MENGVGGSMVGEQFSEIHTDLITETTINRDVKVRDHPMGRGYSTSERTIDNFIKTSHLMAAIQRKFKEKLSHMTSFSHKLVSPVSRSKYDNTIPGLTNHSQNLFYYFNISSQECKLRKALLMDCSNLKQLEKNV